MRSGEIWTHLQYELSDGSYKPKHLIILGERNHRFEVLYARLTSRPNGLPDNPPCYHGNPRSGYYLGVPGGILNKETWVVFDDIAYLDSRDMRYLTNSNLMAPTAIFCSLLRCIQQSEDILGIQYDQIMDTIQSVRCQ